MREFLKGLDLDKETIDTIMAEHGKLITEAKEEIMSLKEKVSGLDKEKEGYEKKIKSYETKFKDYDDNLKNLQSMANENKDLKTQLQMSSSNVKKEFSKFVTNEVSSLVDDETDFATALENYKKENPQYFGETVIKKVQSSPSVGQGGGQAETTNDIMNNLLRGSVKE